MHPGKRGPGIPLSGRAKWLLPLCLLLFIALCIRQLVFVAPPERQIVEIKGQTMGTTYTVKLAHVDLTADRRRELANAIQERLDLINGLMSTYDPESELSRFNDVSPETSFIASPQVIEVFRAARKISDLSGGAFDITVGPLVEAWGFGPSNRTLDPDSERKIEELRHLVDYRAIEISTDGTSLLKRRAGIHCDLSAIAKGYGVDQVSAVLMQLRYVNFLVEIGGEVRAMGKKLDGSKWRIAIEKPDTSADTRQFYEIVNLRDLAMATSGDYRNFFKEGGKRYSHTIDPRTGRPIRHNLASVTVFHESTMMADGLATALNVLGPEAGYALAMQQGLAAFFIIRNPDGSFQSRATPEYRALDREPINREPEK